MNKTGKWKTKSGHIIKKYTVTDVIEKMIRKSKEAEETHKTNGGMCQHCGKNKAEYPAGNPNVYHCAECNAHTRSILAQLHGSPGFTEFRL